MTLKSLALSSDSDKPVKIKTKGNTSDDTIIPKPSIPMEDPDSSGEVSSESEISVEKTPASNQQIIISSDEEATIPLVNIKAVQQLRNVQTQISKPALSPDSETKPNLLDKESVSAEISLKKQLFSSEDEWPSAHSSKRPKIEASHAPIYTKASKLSISSDSDSKPIIQIVQNSSGFKKHKPSQPKVTNEFFYSHLSSPKGEIGAIPQKSIEKKELEILFGDSISDVSDIEQIRMPKKRAKSDDTSSDSEQIIPRRRKKLKRKDTIKTRRVTRAMNSDVEILSLPSEHTETDEPIFIPPQHHSTESSDASVIPWVHIPRKKPKKSSFSSEVEAVSPITPPKKSKFVRDEYERSFRSDSEDEFGSVVLLWCSKCKKEQPIDNFSKMEQTNPKYGTTGRICLVHRGNSGVGKMDNDALGSQTKSRFLEDLERIEEKYEKVNDVAELADSVGSSDDESDISQGGFSIVSELLE